MMVSKNPEKYTLKDKQKYIKSGRNSYLKRVYGITLDQYNEILEKQNGVCAVCQNPERAKNKSLAVDHDHKTGEIFGLLCFFCNHKFVGRNRNPELYLKAAAYLTKGTGWIVPPKPKKKRKKKIVKKDISNPRRTRSHSVSQ